MQLLDPGPLRTSSQDASGPTPSSQDALGVTDVQTQVGPSSGCPGDATNAAAAAAAAAVTAAAPLIKVYLEQELLQY